MNAGVEREAEFRAYLLGALPPERQEEIDASFLADGDVHAELQATADDLIHAYLAGQLSGEDRQRFETHFLATPRRQERVAFVRSLVAATERVRAGQRKPRVGWRAWPALPWAAVLVVALGAGGLRIVERRRGEWELTAARQRESALQQELTARETRLRELEGRIAATGEPEIATWVLDARVERDPGGSDGFTVSGEWVRLRVPLGPDPGVPSYRARVETPEGREVFRAGGLREASRGGRRTLDVMVPAGLLRPGTYLLSIRRDAPGASEELMAKTFTVR